MPRLDSFKAVEIVREEGSDIPFIVISGMIGEDVAVEVMKSGANDYLLKDNLIRLVPAIERELEEAESRRRRRRAEEALRESEKRFQSFARLSADWFFELDADLRYTYFSGPGSVDGLFPEDFIGKTREELLGEAFDPGALDDELHAWREREPYRHIVRRSDVTGNEWLRLSGEPIFAEDGAFLDYRGTSANVTASVEAERAIQANEAQLRLVTDNLPVLIVQFDAELRFQFANRVCQEWYARPLDQIVGVGADEVLDAEAMAFLRPHLEATIQGETTSFEYRITYPDGITRDVEITNVPNRDLNGDVVGCFGLVSDITERKAAEEAVLAAMEQAEIANRTKSDFLSNMSHELRTPLNAIIGFSEIIKQKTLGPVGNAKYREYVGDINASGQHLLGLINSILDLSKVESGTDELYEENIDVPETVRLIMRLSMGAAQMGNVDLVSEVPDGIPALRADASKVKLILINLLSNAVKFTPDGGKVTLKSWSGAESGYVFQVTDTGIGIFPAAIPKALAPFQQINSHLNRKHEGTGLGLPLTKSFVESHDGYLDVQSEVGIGTTVTVCFPAERIVCLPHYNGSRKRR